MTTERDNAAGPSASRSDRISAMSGLTAGPTMSDAAGMIDVHTHSILPAWREAMAARQNVAVDDLEVAGVKIPPWSAEQHIAYMDRQGIAAGVLSWPEGVTVAKGSEARDLARSMNEAWAQTINAHPTRFGAFAAAPFDDMDAAIAETIYALDVLKLDGVACAAQIDGAYLGDARYEDWFAELDRRSAVLFIHPGVPAAMEQVFVGPNASTLEFMFDSTRMITKMVITGAKARYPNIRMISTHGGGTMPYLAHRLAISTPIFNPRIGLPAMTHEDVRRDLASFYYDLTASTSAAQLDALRRLVPPSQLLMGFDYPMMPEALTMPELGAFEAYPGFTTADRLAIRCTNALSLFPQLAGRRHAET